MLHGISLEMNHLANDWEEFWLPGIPLTCQRYFCQMRLVDQNDLVCGVIYTLRLLSM